MCIRDSNFECALSDIVEIQHEIVRQITTSLKLTLTGDEERRITARYTDNSDAYQAYLEGRFHWSRYTREGIERAIIYFCRAIELDPNYALAYSAVIDCYLRLITNYLPPEAKIAVTPKSDPVSRKQEPPEDGPSSLSIDSESKVKLRHEWDWKGAERELRRANELKAYYPSAHQWYAAFLFVRQMYQVASKHDLRDSAHTDVVFPPKVQSGTLTPSEEVQVLCTIAREQIGVGSFEAARLLLERWLPKIGWPKLTHLDSNTAADLLFTLGQLIGFLSITGQIVKGHKRAESYLSGSIAILEQSGSKVPAAEARIELARCYFREGLFDDARELLTFALKELPDEETELRSLGLSIFGCVEREAGRFHESLMKFEDAAAGAGQLVAGHRHLQMATTLKELANLESKETYYREAEAHFQQALCEFEAIGNHRNVAAAENNLGYFLLCSGAYKESEDHLLHALKLFQAFSDEVRVAQVNETLTHLYIAQNNLPRAKKTIDKAVRSLERSDGSGPLAEALITKGIVESRQGNYAEARKSFESGHTVAERCGDGYGAGRALLTMLEELGNQLMEDDKAFLITRLTKFLKQRQHTLLLTRLTKLLSAFDGDFN